MQYRELIQFDPINEVVKFERLDNADYRKSLVRNFVFSEAYEKTIIPELCRNLDYTASYETFGLQIVGNYGTGKSHLMSLFSLIAEDAELLPLVQNDSVQQVLGNIAGKYKVIRFELGSDDELWKLVCYQIDKALSEWRINYSILNDNTPDQYSDKLRRMLAHFEQAFPDKGLMIVIDEMLSYLKGRSGADRINRDLAVLQALGQMSDHSKFRMVFGVQELIYNAPEFAFASNMLNKVNDRFRQIQITKQDVQFVVQQRLLRKDDNQKEIIRKHLMKFTEFFSDMHAHLNEYVNLFPVNPSYFENFQQIKIGKSQREVLKTLSRKFGEIKDEEVPTSEPGLICYDSYWEELQTSEMQTYPDVRRVTEIMGTIHQKIDENFTGARTKRVPLAKRIANACAIKILQDSLEKTNGVTAENLVDDLCYLDEHTLDREFLIDTMNTTARQIVTATVGQYFEKNETNQEYHLRVEGGVNYEQKIKDFAATMSEDNKDSHFFNFLVEYLPIDVEQYRREFKIFRHSIDWKSHKTMVDGYIFMGHPNERSTTHPQQNFYIYFMPIFNKTNMKCGDESDSIYVNLDKVSDEMKNQLELYAAAESLIKSVDSSQKPFYQQFKKSYEDRLKTIFHEEFTSKVEIVYLGEVQTVSFANTIGNSKEQIISDIASTLLEDYFCQIMPDYPKFTLLHAPLTANNKATLLKSARMKIANSTQPNRDGEAILSGLGLYQDNQLSIEGSIYAQSIKEKLEKKGEGQVLNRDEIIYRFYKDWEDDWRSKEFHIDADLVFIVLSAMVAVGEIEIDLPGLNVNAANLREIIDLPADSFHSFSHIRKPKNMNLALVRKIFMAIVGKDLTSQLSNPETYTELVSKSSKIAASAVKLSHDIGAGIYLENIPIISQEDGDQLKARLDPLRTFCDRLQTFNTQAKLRNLPADWTSESLQPIFDTIPEIAKIHRTLLFVDDFRERLSYLNQTQQYMVSEEMRDRVATSMAKMTDVIASMSDEGKVQAYKDELDTLRKEYAEWYISEYKRMHITELQDSEKRRLQQSNENRVCEAIISADHDRGYFSQGAEYTEWSRKMMLLNMANINTTLEAVMRTPYVGFNPLQYDGVELPDLGQLKEELEGIYNKIETSLSEMLKDEELLDNKDILDSSELGLLNRFISGGEQLDPANATRLAEIVAKLHQGLRKIHITDADLRNAFNRPLTPKEAIKEFERLIKNAVGSGDDSNVRIIFK